MHLHLLNLFDILLSVVTHNCSSVGVLRTWVYCPETSGVKSQQFERPVMGERPSLTKSVVTLLLQQRACFEGRFQGHTGRL